MKSEDDLVFLSYNPLQQSRHIGWLLAHCIALHCFACYNRFKWGWFQEIRCCWCGDTLLSVLWLQLPLSLTQQIHWHNVLWQAYSLGCTREALLVHFLKSKILLVIFQLTILSTGTFCRWILPYHANVLEAHYMVSVVCCRTQKAVDCAEA